MFLVVFQVAPWHVSHFPWLNQKQDVQKLIHVCFSFLSLYLKINIEKTSQKVVTKDPRRQERGKKSHETYMKRLKEKMLEDNQLSTPPPMDRPKRSTPSSAGNSTPYAF